MTGLFGVALLFGSAWAWGAAALRRCALPALDLLLLRLTVGLGVLSTAVWLLGTTGLLYPWALALLLVLPVGLLVARRVSLSPLPRLEPPGPGAAALCLAFALVVACNTLEAMTWDDCPDRYHVIHMRNAYNLHAFANPPNVLTSYYPQFIDHLFAPMFLFTREDAGSLVNNAFACLLALAAFAAARRLAGPTAGWLAAGLLATNLQLNLLAPFGYNDLGAAFLTTMAFYALLLAWQRELAAESRRLVVLAGLFAGWSLQSRINAGLYALALGGVAWLVTLMLSRGARMPQLRRAALWAACALLAASPWMIRNALTTGSPFLPLGTGLFPVGVDLQPAVLGYHYEFGWMPPSWRQWPYYLWIVPYGATAEGHTALFALMLAAPVVVIHAWWRRRWWALSLLCFTAAGVVLAAFVRTTKARYFLPMVDVPPVAVGVLVAQLLEEVGARRRRLQPLALAALALLVLGLYPRVIQYRGHLTSRPPLTPAARMRCQNLRDASCPYWTRINREARPDDRLLVAGVNLRYQYLNIPFSPPPYYGKRLDELVMARNPTAEGVTRELRGMRYTLILAPPGAPIVAQASGETLAAWPRAVLIRLPQAR